jgi:hypothetical protein
MKATRIGMQFLGFHNDLPLVDCEVGQEKLLAPSNKPLCLGLPL